MKMLRRYMVIAAVMMLPGCVVHTYAPPHVVYQHAPIYRPPVVYRPPTYNPYIWHQPRHHWHQPRYYRY